MIIMSTGGERFACLPGMCIPTQRQILAKVHGRVSSCFECVYRCIVNINWRLFAWGCLLWIDMHVRLSHLHHWKQDMTSSSSVMIMPDQLFPQLLLIMLSGRHIVGCK